MGLGFRGGLGFRFSGHSWVLCARNIPREICTLPTVLHQCRNQALGQNVGANNYYCEPYT